MENIQILWYYRRNNGGGNHIIADVQNQPWQRSDSDRRESGGSHHALSSCLGSAIFYSKPLVSIHTFWSLVINWYSPTSVIQPLVIWTSLLLLGSFRLQWTRTNERSPDNVCPQHKGYCACAAFSRYVNTSITQILNSKPTGFSLSTDFHFVHRPFTLCTVACERRGRSLNMTSYVFVH